MYEVNPEPLTPRQTEVVQLVARGYTNAEVAEKLHVVEYAINRHINNINRIWLTENRTHITIFALKAGIVTVDECYEALLERQLKS